MPFNKKALVCALLYMENNKKNKRKYCVHPIFSDRLINGKFHTIHSNLKLYPDKFFQFYRMSEPSFREIITLIGSHIHRRDTTWRLSISPEERLSVTLRYLATGASFNALSYEFLLGATTIRQIVKNTSDVLWEILQPIYMSQKTEEEWIEIADQFYTRTNFPNVIGAIDGKHIRIIQPQHSGSLFFNYKKYFSCVLMAWTDADYKFVCVDVGSYGSSCDSAVFKNSKMGQKLMKNNFNVPRGRKLPNDNDGKTIPFVVVGDDAFGLHDNLLRPYAKKNLSYDKLIYNYRHTRARRMVECTFGILANKWRILHRPLDVNIDFAVAIVKACCILHNFVRIKDGIIFEDTLYANLGNINTSANDNRGRNIIGGLNVRQYLTSYFVSPQGSVPWQYEKV